MATNTSEAIIETNQTGNPQPVTNSTPWEGDYSHSSHADLIKLRTQTDDKEAQNKLAPWEHRAFAREAVADNPAMAIPIAIATPIYSASKALGLEKSRSDASLEEVKQGYIGIAEGLAQPWQKAWNDAKTSVGNAVRAVTDAVSSPWDKMWGGENKPPVAPPSPVPKPSKFEVVFNNLINAESEGMHTDSSGKLLTSEAGAQGVTQLMKATANDPGYGVQPVKDQSKAEYVRFGRDYLQAMLKEFGGDYHKALAAYNAGVGNVKKAITKAENKGGDWKEYLPKKAETLPYIAKIMKGIN